MTAKPSVCFEHTLGADSRLRARWSDGFVFGGNSVTPRRRDQVKNRERRWMETACRLPGATRRPNVGIVVGAEALAPADGLSTKC